MDDRTRRRRVAERRFRAYGLVAIGIALLFLAVLLGNIVAKGLPAFSQTSLTLPVHLAASKLDPKGNRDIADLKKATTFRYGPLLDRAMADLVAKEGITTDLKPKKMGDLLSSGAASPSARCGAGRSADRGHHGLLHHPRLVPRRWLPQGPRDPRA